MNEPDFSAGREKSVHLQVFGCQMNKLDAELVHSALAARGYTACDTPDEAGLVLFITCSVRDHAEERVHSRLGALKRLKKSRPDLVIGLLGCMAQEHAEALFARHAHLDIVCGTRDFHAIADLVERVRSGESKVVAVDATEPPAVERNESLRPAPFQAFLSVMRGCDRYCSYCIVPFVRGREVSRPAEEIVSEAGRLVADGVKEITLLGQTVNNYSDADGVRLAGLLRRIDPLPGLERLHFVTSHPSYVDDDLIAAVADCRTVTRFLHLPIQSGSDRILKLMNRRYTAKSYLRNVEKLRAAAPDIELGSDFIVGFPGESDADFRETLRVMEEVRFQQSFVFRYSPRPGTVAERRFDDDVPLAIKRERNTLLLETQERIGFEKNAGLVGREVEVLVEGESRRDARRYTGRTRQNQIVVFPGDASLVGRIVPVRVTGHTALTLIGDLATEENR